MSAPKVTALLAGAEKLKRELQLAIPHVRAGVIAAIKKNTKIVAAGARSKAPKKTGELVGTIRDEYSADGLTGFVRVGFGKLPRRSRAKTARGLAHTKGRKRPTGRGAYSPVVERGDPRRHKPAEPFLIPSFTQQKPEAMTDIGKALNDTLGDIKGNG